MRVGDSLEIPYDLPGSLPAGRYQVRLTGYQSSNDGVVRFTLAHRPAHGADSLLSTTEARVSSGPDGGNQTELSVALDGGAITTCGHRLILRVEVLSGSSDFLELAVELTLP
jgi:hypothetical protein